jgi:2-keto-3-deoxy-L-fuconate dehydrogenase
MTQGDKTGRLAAKRALVTAAGQGIGRAIAEAFAAEGAAVLATDLRPDLVEALAAQHRGIRAAALDVTDPAQIAGVVGAAGPIDILVNAAGLVQDNSVLDCDEAAWSLAFALNVTPMFRMMQAVLPGMLDRGQGSIVNIASVASSLKGVPRRFSYSTTKAAIIGMTKSVAADFIARGIRANAICPGTVDTPSLQGRVRDAAAVHGSVEKARAAFVARQPMGRLGRAEEIAALAVHLAGDEAGFTTGQAFVIDGGWMG